MLLNTGKFSGEGKHAVLDFSVILITNPISTMVDLLASAIVVVVLGR